MKLEIDLSDRSEIEAAVPLLQLILDGTTVPQRAAPLPVTHAPSIAAVTPLPTAPVEVPGSLTVALVPQPPAPPAPALDALTGTAALPTPPAPGVDRDSAGLPWDERIHASTKSKIADGTWKSKRGVDAALVVAVEEELRAAYQNVTGVHAVTPAGIGGHPEQGALDPAQAFGGAAAPAPLPIAPPAAPSAPAAPVAPLVSAGPTTFEQLMLLVSGAIVARQIPPTALQEACAANGLTSVVALQQNPAFVPPVWASMQQANPVLA